MEEFAANVGFSNVNTMLVYGAGAVLLLSVVAPEIYAKIRESIVAKINESLKTATGIDAAKIAASASTPAGTNLADLREELEGVPGIDDAAKWAYLKSGKSIKAILIEELAKKNG